MGEITLSGQALQAIQAVEDYVSRWTIQELKEMEKPPEGRIRTQLHIIDCVEDGERVVFVVEKGHLGMAIGRSANHLAKLREILSKDVKFVEFDTDKALFIQNLFKPFKCEKVSVDPKKEGGPLAAVVIINEEEKGKAIGKAGKNINLVRLLAKRHHGIEEVRVL